MESVCSSTPRQHPGDDLEVAVRVVGVAARRVRAGRRCGRPAVRSRGWPGRSAGRRRTSAASHGPPRAWRTSPIRRTAPRPCRYLAVVTTAPHGSFPLLPAGFRFGTSTAAYQIEGAATEGGRGPSIWDTFAAEPGRDRRRLHRRGGVRPLPPRRRGRRADGAARRRRLPLLDRRGRGSSPTGAAGQRGGPRVLRPAARRAARRTACSRWSTLYHWDLPQALEDDGRLAQPGHRRRASPSTPPSVGERFVDRVEHWVPVNEPNVASLLGYGLGMHAPGRTLMFDSLPAAHHLLLAHGRAAIELRRAGAHERRLRQQPRARCGRPATTTPTSGPARSSTRLWNGMFLEPMLLGRYPVDLAPLLDGLAEPGDMATIRQPLDFYGVNYYNPMKIAAAAEDADMPFELRDVVGYPTTDFGWPVVPDALREWLIMFRARYRAALPPIMITESGCAYNMGPDADGVVDDQPRIDYLRRPPHRRRRGHRPRRRRPRLLLLVAAGQLRVGRGPHPALRPGARRLRHPAAHAQALLPVVRRRDRRPARERVRVRDRVRRMSSRRVVFVVGSGRSGTSTMSGTLQTLGLHVPAARGRRRRHQPQGLRRAAVGRRPARRAARAQQRPGLRRPAAGLAGRRHGSAATTPPASGSPTWLESAVRRGDDELVHQGPAGRPGSSGCGAACADRCDATSSYITMLRPVTEVVGSKKKYYDAAPGRRHPHRRLGQHDARTPSARPAASSARFVRYGDLLGRLDPAGLRARRGLRPARR